MTSALAKGRQAISPSSLVILTLAALSLPANLLIVAVFYWSGTHQVVPSATATAWATAAVAVILLVMGGMLWSLRRGWTGLDLALAVVQLLPAVLLGASLAFAALR